MARDMARPPLLCEQHPGSGAAWLKILFAGRLRLARREAWLANSLIKLQEYSRKVLERHLFIENYRKVAITAPPGDSA
jgi:hypothetical protein